MCVNGKMRPVKTIPGMGGEINENDGGWIQVQYITRPFVNITIYPPSTQ
jgi:hypothetical protein